MDDFVASVFTSENKDNSLYVEEFKLTKTTKSIRIVYLCTKILLFDTSFKIDEKNKIHLVLSMTRTSSNVDKISQQCVGSHRTKLESRIKERNKLGRRLNELVSKLTHIPVSFDSFSEGSHEENLEKMFYSTKCDNDKIHPEKEFECKKKPMQNNNENEDVRQMTRTELLSEIDHLTLQIATHNEEIKKLVKVQECTSTHQLEITTYSINIPQNVYVKVSGFPDLDLDGELGLLWSIDNSPLNEQCTVEKKIINQTHKVDLSNVSFH